MYSSREPYVTLLCVWQMKSFSASLGYSLCILSFVLFVAPRASQRIVFETIHIFFWSIYACVILSYVSIQVIKINKKLCIMVLSYIFILLSISIKELVL